MAPQPGPADSPTLPSPAQPCPVGSRKGRGRADGQNRHPEEFLSRRQEGDEEA